MAFERRLHDAALHASPAAVDDPDLGEASAVRRAQVLVDHRRDVARREGVEIDRVFDWDVDGVSILHSGRPLLKAWRTPP
jgi:hypothetical protein